MKSNFFSKIILFFISALFLINCNTSENKIPYVYVNIVVDIDKPEFMELNAIGNFVYITGGVSGIIVYRDGLYDFFAYERACPYDPECGRVHVDESGYRLVDTCCGSEFSLTMDGAVLKGPSDKPLRKYITYYNENTNQLIITNQ